MAADSRSCTAPAVASTARIMVPVRLGSPRAPAGTGGVGIAG